MNICYNLAKVLLPLFIPEVLPTHMSRETDVSLTYFHHMPVALFKTKNKTKKHSLEMCHVFIKQLF